MTKQTLLLCSLLISMLVGCSDSDISPTPSGEEYYPIAIGDYRIYSVTDIKIKFNKGDTTRYQIRERVDTTFLDQTNTLNYKIVRSIRPNANSQWTDDSVMVVNKTNSMVLLTKDNTKYVNLVFPVKEGYDWVVDAYNNRSAPFWASKSRNGKLLYKYADVGAKMSLNGITYPETVKVLLDEPIDNSINLLDKQEYYAKGIGKIYSFYNRAEVTSCSNDDCENGESYIIQGHKREEVLITYGKK